MTGKITKVAMIRKPGYPPGQPAPMTLNCQCGAKPDAPRTGTVTCACGVTYTATGRVLS